MTTPVEGLAPDRVTLEAPPGRGWRHALRRRAADIAATLISWLVTLIVVGDSLEAERYDEEVGFVMLIVGWLSSLAIWWRRSHPLAMNLLFVPIGAFTDAAAYAGLVVLYTLVVLRRGRVIAVVLLLSVGSGAVFSWVWPIEELPYLVEVTLVAAVLAATVAIGVAVRSRRELITSLRERAARAEAEAELRADRLRSLERERIAREMHDALAHRISMVSLHAGALQIRPDLSPEEVARAAATIRDSAHHALEDLREILGVLRAGEVAGEGLRPQPDLTRLDELIAGAGVRVDVDNRLGDATVTPSLGRTVYRLVQEGLTNAGKHAPGVRVHLLLERNTEGELHVLLANPLAVRPAMAPPGAEAGLVGLAERVELVGGRLRHGVRRDADGRLAFHLEAWLPWPT